MNKNTKSAKPVVPPDELLTTEEVAKILKLHNNSVRRICQQGRLKSLRICGRLTRIRPADLNAFIEGK